MDVCDPEALVGRCVEIVFSGFYLWYRMVIFFLHSSDFAIFFLLLIYERNVLIAERNEGNGRLTTWVFVEIAARILFSFNFGTYNLESDVGAWNGDLLIFVF